MTVFVGGVLAVLGSDMMLHMFGVVALASGICFAIRAFSIGE